MKKLGIEDRFIIKNESSRKQVLQAYKKADIFVLSTLHEMYGIVLVEAMASGLPIIATDVAAVGEIVTDDIGITVPVCDDYQLYLAIKELIENKEKRTLLGQSARKKAEVKFLGRIPNKSVSPFPKDIPKISDFFEIIQ